MVINSQTKPRSYAIDANYTLQYKLKRRMPHSFVECRHLVPYFSRNAKCMHVLIHMKDLELKGLFHLLFQIFIKSKRQDATFVWPIIQAMYNSDEPENELRIKSPNSFLPLSEIFVEAFVNKGIVSLMLFYVMSVYFYSATPLMMCCPLLKPVSFFSSKTFGYQCLLNIFW